MNDLASWRLDMFSVEPAPFPKIDRWLRLSTGERYPLALFFTLGKMFGTLRALRMAARYVVCNWATKLNPALQASKP